MSNYIHGTQPDEQSRLTKLNDLINESCLKLLELKAGESVLDIGSGLGQFTLRSADVVGASGRCLGIERDKNQLKGALQNLEIHKRSNVEFRQGNAENLELSTAEWGSFDVAHARFVLEHVPQPDSVVRGMAKAVRLGGRILLLDDDHASLCLYPEPSGFSHLWNAYVRSYDRLGNDPHVGRRMVSLLYHCGIRDIRNGVVFFGDSGESETFQAYARNLINILEGARPTLIKESLMTELNYDESMDHLRTWSRRPDAAMWYTIFWAKGVKPTGQ